MGEVSLNLTTDIPHCRKDKNNNICLNTSPKTDLSHPTWTCILFIFLREPAENICGPAMPTCAVQKYMIQQT